MLLLRTSTHVTNIIFLSCQFYSCSQADVREPHADGAGDRARPKRAHRLPRRGAPEADQVRLVLQQLLRSGNG